MHDGSVRQGDTWLQQNLGDYAEWAKTHNSLLIVTFDEGEEDGVNHIPTIIYGDGVVPGEYGQAADHYDLLRTIEDLYGLPALGHAAQAEVMRYGAADPDDPDDPDGTDGADTFIGTSAADVFDGGAGDDIIRGLGGNDSLLGGDGNDRLVGAAGNDELTGEAGDDAFRFNKGQDTITDFQDGSIGDDLLWFDDLLWGGQVLTANQILAFAHVEGSDILFDFGNGNTLRLQGTTNIGALADDLVVV
jgi:Ca2+-binding RTX toxin-like protein